MHRCHACLSSVQTDISGASHVRMMHHADSGPACQEESYGCMMRLTSLQATPAMAETHLSRSRGARLGCSLWLLCTTPEGRTGLISSLPLLHG